MKILPRNKEYLWGDFLDLLHTLTAERIITPIIFLFDLVSDFFMIFREFRPVETPLQVMGGMISEIPRDTIVPGGYDIIGRLIVTLALKTRMMIIRRIDGQKESSDHRKEKYEYSGKWMIYEKNSKQYSLYAQHREEISLDLWVFFPDFPGASIRGNTHHPCIHPERIGFATGCFPC